MGRYLYAVYHTAKTPRFVVLWSIHWAVIECERLEAGTNLSDAMAATVSLLASEGWSYSSSLT